MSYKQIAEDFTTAVVTFMGIVLSYLSDINTLRYLALLVAISYNIHRWYLMIKNNKKDGEK